MNPILKLKARATKYFDGLEQVDHNRKASDLLNHLSRHEGTQATSQDVIKTYELMDQTLRSKLLERLKAIDTERSAIVKFLNIKEIC